MTTTFKFRINGQTFESIVNVLTGKQILEISGLEPPQEFELLLKLQKQEFEPVQLDEMIDLDRHGIEMFSAKPYKNIKFFVDDEPIHTKECFLTPAEILRLVSKDPKEYYLKQILGHKEITYKNDEDHILAMKSNLKFTTCKREGATVS